MGLFYYVYVDDPRFVCSEGHDLSGEEFQSKDFGCEMGSVTVANGTVTTRKVCLGEPSPSGDTAEVYCTCTKCPAFVQFGTGNIVGHDVNFVLRLKGRDVVTITRDSPDTAAWLISEPASRWMRRCEGPMPYAEAMQVHIHYQKMRPAEYAEFKAWQHARSVVLKAGGEWPMDLAVGECPP